MAGDPDDENIFDEGEFEEDGTAKLIREAWEAEEGEDGEDDDGGFDQPLEDNPDAPDVVSPDKGRDLLDKAEVTKERTRRADSEAAKPDDEAAQAPKDGKTDSVAKADDKSGEDTAQGAEADDKAGEDGDGDKPDLTQAEASALLEGMPDDRKAEVTRRLAEAENVLKPFQSPYIKDQMQRFGATPDQVASRLADLASFANTNPDEYIAWMAKEAGGDDPSELLGKAAERLGYKLTKVSDDDDDVFLDPEVKRIKEENERLKRQVNGETDFGPDTPERQQARQMRQQLDSFINERDETGNLKRPGFQQLEPVIAQAAAQHRQQTGKPATMEDLDRFYTAAVEQVRSAMGVPAGQMGAPEPPSGQPGGEAGTSAAQSGQSVSDQIKTKAAAAQRAQRASKSVDGTGQGASRRPALSENASLDDVIRHFANQGE